MQGEIVESKGSSEDKNFGTNQYLHTRIIETLGTNQDSTEAVSAFLGPWHFRLMSLARAVS
jgi:hypothetical protein